MTEMVLCDAVESRFVAFSPLASDSELDEFAAELSAHVVECGCDPLDVEALIVDQRLNRAIEPERIGELGLTVQSVGDQCEVTPHYLLGQLADSIALSLSPDSVATNAKRLELQRLCERWDLSTSVAAWRTNVPLDLLEAFRDIEQHASGESMTLPAEWAVDDPK